MSALDYLAPFVRRQAEWLAAIIMAGDATVLALSPQSLEFGGFYLIGHIGLSALRLSAVLMACAACRIACLLANGRWPHAGPRCRTVCAVIGVVLWAQLGYSLLVWSLAKGYIGIGVPLYATLALSELVTLFRVVSDGAARR